jgi:hypothetical protein
MAALSPTETRSPRDLEREIDRFVDECRVDSLWYLRPDYYPGTDFERCRVLEAIQKHSNLDNFKRAARLKACLSPPSSATSA